MTPEVTFFPSAAAFGLWLAEHHASATERWVGFWRKDSGRGGLTYPEALDEALCWGWIDGIRKKVDAESYTNRFTPRKPDSSWSAVNVRHVQRLLAEGRMQPPGIAAYEARDRATKPTSWADRPQTLAPELEQQLRRDATAWRFFRDQPPGYRKTAAFFVMRAKRAETRQRRLDLLIAHSAAGERLPQVAGRPIKKRATRRKKR